jgi:hypothetical protein
MFYNVTGTWQSSGIPGAWMMRPILGKNTNLKIPTIDLENRGISVFPNPAKNQLTVTGLNASEPFSYEIFNPLGQLVESGKSNDFMVPLNFEQSGIFLLYIYQNNTKVVRKFIKE